ASEAMALLEAERLLQHKRGNIRQELEAVSEEHSEGTEMQTITVYKLMQSFEKVMKKFQERNNKPQHVVVKYNYSQEGQREFLLDYMKNRTEAAFEAVFSICETRIHAIFTFLALLELVQQKFFRILTGEGRNNFILEWGEGAFEENPKSLE